VVAEEWIMCSVDEYKPFLNRPFTATMSWMTLQEKAAAAVPLCVSSPAAPAAAVRD